MIDTLKMWGYIDPPKEVVKGTLGQVQWNGHLFDPIIDNNLLRGYKANLENLKLGIYGDRLFISNSLQKYFHQSNTGDFHFSEVVSAIQMLSSDLSYPLDQLKITRIDYAVNLPLNPESIYKPWERYKHKKFVPCLSRGRIYGKKAYLSTHSIKGYNKAFEVLQTSGMKLGNEIFRFEVSVKDMRHLTKRRKDPIPIYYAKDLLDMSNIYKLTKDLSVKSRSIGIKTSIDFEGLPNPTKDIPIIAVMSNEATKEAFKNSSSLSTYKRFQRRYKRLIQTLGTEQGQRIEQAIKVKCKELETPIS